MAFSAEEILEEFAEVAHFQRGAFIEDGSYYVIRRPGRGESLSAREYDRQRYARVKADPEWLAHRRRIARESQKRRYWAANRKKQAERARAYYAKVKADPARYADMMAKKTQARKRRERQRGGKRVDTTGGSR
jgi:hypothetical protein